jgi:hypothetical protein
MIKVTHGTVIFDPQFPSNDKKSIGICIGFYTGTEHLVNASNRSGFTTVEQKQVLNNALKTLVNVVFEAIKKQPFREQSGNIIPMDYCMGTICVALRFHYRTNQWEIGFGGNIIFCFRSEQSRDEHLEKIKNIIMSYRMNKGEFIVTDC